MKKLVASIIVCTNLTSCSKEIQEDTDRVQFVDGVNGYYLSNEKTYSNGELKYIVSTNYDAENRSLITERLNVSSGEIETSSRIYLNSKGQREKTEIDSDNNGKTDATMYFEYNLNNMLIQQSYDVDNDGEIDDNIYYTWTDINKIESFEAVNNTNNVFNQTNYYVWVTELEVTVNVDRDDSEFSDATVKIYFGENKHINRKESIDVEGGVISYTKILYDSNNNRLSSESIHSNGIVFSRSEFEYTFTSEAIYNSGLTHELIGF